MRAATMFCGCWICIACAARTYGTPSLNLEQATADTTAKLAQGGQANIVLIGDSLAHNDVYSFRPYFTRHMQAFYGDAGPGYVGAASAVAAPEPGWTTGQYGPSDPEPHLGLDGLWLQAPAAATPASGITLIPYWHDNELQYLAQPGGGAFAVVDPVTHERLGYVNTCAATTTVRNYFYDFPTDVRIVPQNNGPVTLLGINRISEIPGVRIHRAANGGWSMTQFLQRDPTFDEQLRLLGTDLVMVALGVNDSGLPREQFVRNLNLLLDRLGAAVPDAEIVLVTPYDYGRPQTPVVAGAIEEVAAARSLGLINLYETAGSHQFFQDQNYLSDGLHFSAAGGEYVGDMLFEAFRTNGASLTTASPAPEPGSCGLVAGGAALLLLRRRRRAVPVR